MRVRCVSLLVLTLASCHPAVGPVTPRSASAPEEERAMLLRAAGDRAALVVLLDQRRWREAEAERLRWSDALHRNGSRWASRGLVDYPSVRTLAQLLRAPDLLKALVLSVGLMPLESSDALDPERPIALAFYDSASPDIGAVARVLFAGHLEDLAPTVRHRALLPARDPVALAAALVTSLQKAGLEPLPGKPGCFTSRERAFAVVPEGNRVRVEMVTGRPPSAPFEPPRAGTVSRKWLDAIDAPPSTAPLPDTAAVAQVIAGHDLLSAWLRPRRELDFALASDTAHVADGLVGLHPSMKATLACKATSEMMSARILFAAERALADDVAIGLSPGRVTALISLTEWGVDVARAVARAVRFPSFTSAPSALRARVALSATALRDAASRPEEEAGEEELRAMLKECGTPCLHYWLLDNPLALARLGLSVVPRTQMLPDGLAVSVPEGGTRSRAAVAVRFPPGVDAVRAFQSWMRTARIEVEVHPRPPVHWLWLGFNHSVKDAFTDEPEVELSAGTLAEFEIDPDAWSDADADLPPAGHDATAPGRTLVRGRLRVTDDALTAELHLNDPVATPAPFSVVTVNGHVVPSPPASAGTVCLVRALRTIRRAFGSVAGVDASQKMALVRGCIATTRESLECALRDPATKQEAESLAQMLALTPAALEAQERADN